VLQDPNLKVREDYADLAKLVDEISSLTVMESTDLANMLQDKWKFLLENGSHFQAEWDLFRQNQMKSERRGIVSGGIEPPTSRFLSRFHWFIVTQFVTQAAKGAEMKCT
jgi:hypothetical protein